MEAHGWLIMGEQALRATIARVDVHVRDLEEKIADQAAALAKRK